MDKVVAESKCQISKSFFVIFTADKKAAKYVTSLWLDQQKTRVSN